MELGIYWRLLLPFGVKCYNFHFPPFSQILFLWIWLRDFFFPLDKAFIAILSRILFYDMLLLACRQVVILCVCLWMLNTYISVLVKSRPRNHCLIWHHLSSSSCCFSVLCPLGFLWLLQYLRSLFLPLCGLCSSYLRLLSFLSTQIIPFYPSGLDSPALTSQKTLLTTLSVCRYLSARTTAIYLFIYLFPLPRTVSVTW